MTLELFLDRLEQNIFVNPYASEGKDSRGIFAPARRVTKKYGLGLRNIQFNGPRQKRYLTFDIDRSLAGLAWEDANLPIPNLIITNPENGHAHLVYELEKPIYERKKDDERSGEAQPVRYYKAVSKAMREALDADPCYTGLLVKNPFHDDWQTVCARLRPYTLGELAQHLELSSQPETRLDYDVEGRNCTLFHSLRHWAYRAKRSFTNVVSFRHAADRELDHLNCQLKQPLSMAELRGIAKSVTKWVWNHYTGSGQTKRRGICHLDQSLTLVHRQQLGQAKSVEQKLLETRARIKLAIKTIDDKGVRLTKTGVARLANLSRSTIHRHWKHVNCPAHVDVGSESLWTVTEKETVSLRDQSSLPPAGACGPAARERYPDAHPKRHFRPHYMKPGFTAPRPTIPEVDRILAIIKAMAPKPPERPPDPVYRADPISVSQVRQTIDKLYERATKRLN